MLDMELDPVQLIATGKLVLAYPSNGYFASVCVGQMIPPLRGANSIAVHIERAVHSKQVDMCGATIIAAGQFDCKHFVAGYMVGRLSGNQLAVLKVLGVRESPKGHITDVELYTEQMIIIDETD